MVYLDQQIGLSRVAIPRAVGFPGWRGPVDLTLRRGGVTRLFSGLLDADMNTLFYILDIDVTEELPAGEYDYELTDPEGEELSCGIMTVGEFKPDIVAVTTESKVKEYGG